MGCSPWGRNRPCKPGKCLSWDIVEKAHEVGIRTLTLAEKWGGLGADSLTTAMVVEELAKGDMGVSVVMAQTFKIAQLIELNPKCLIRSPVARAGKALHEQVERGEVTGD